MINEDLLNKLNEQDVEVSSPPPINVSEIITFGFNQNDISFAEPKLNETSYKAMLKKDKHWEDFQVPVGYRIHNISTDAIKDIQYPSYTYNASTGNYEGVIKTKDLAPNEFMCLPTLWLMILLLKLGKGCRVANGHFRPIYDLKTNNSDALLRNVYFEHDSLYDKVFTYDNPFSRIFLGGLTKEQILKKEMEPLSIPVQEFQELFGYLMNRYNSTPKGATISSNGIVFIRKVLLKK